MRKASALICIAFAACSDGEDSPQDAYIPMLSFPGPLTVTEDGSTSFVLSTNDFSHGDPRGRVVSTPSGVVSIPNTFDLSPSSPSETITIYGTVAAGMNETFLLEFYFQGAIGGESPRVGVHVVDTSVQNVIASNWNLIAPASSMAMFAVQLTQPASAPVTIRLESSNTAIANVTPATMAFGPTDYNVPQTATVAAGVSGSASIDLVSPLPPQTVLISVQ